MKAHKFVLSTNAWEYDSEVLISANEIKILWASKEDETYSKKWQTKYKEHGNVIIADGVMIRFDEPFIYQGSTE